MKLLFDHNLSPRLIKKLADIYPNYNHLYLMGLDEADDIVVWETAKRQNYIVVTKDSDFNELLIIRGLTPKVIWIRLGNCSTQTIETLLRDNYEVIASFERDESIGILTLY